MVGGCGTETAQKVERFKNMNGCKIDSTDGSSKSETFALQQKYTGPIKSENAHHRCRCEDIVTVERLRSASEANSRGS